MKDQTKSNQPRVEKKAKIFHTFQEEVENLLVPNITNLTNPTTSDTKIALDHTTSRNSSMSEQSDVTGQEPMEMDQKALNLFSRQNAALGAETTAKLIKMKVIVYGMRGVGVETAKNLALQGVGAITVRHCNSSSSLFVPNSKYCHHTLGKTHSSSTLHQLW